MSTGLSVERFAGGRRRYRDRRFDELPARRVADTAPTPPASAAPWPAPGVRSDPFVDALADVVIAAHKLAARSGVDLDSAIATRRGHSTETQAHIYTDVHTHIPTSAHE